MTHLIQIKATSGGWTVLSEGVENGLMSLSGAKAEASAKALAERLSRSGVASEIRIRLRNGAEAGRILWAPANVGVTQVV